MRSIAACAPLLALALIAPAQAHAQRRPRERPPAGGSENREDSFGETGRRGYTIGVTGFTGGTWQPSGMEAGLVRGAAAAPGREIGLMLRLGSFVQDQAVLIGGTRGFFAQLLGMYRLPVATVAMVGSDRNPSYLRFLAVFEAGPSAGINSPLPQGSYHLSAAALFGFSFGDGGLVDEGFSVLAGPAEFLGQASTLHAQVTLRFQSAFRGGRRRGPD